MGEEALLATLIQGSDGGGDRGALFQHSEGDAGKELLSQGMQSGPVASSAFWAQCDDSMAAYRGSICFYVQIYTKNPLCLFTKGYCTNDTAMEDHGVKQTY